IPLLSFKKFNICAAGASTRKVNCSSARRLTWFSRITVSSTKSARRKLEKVKSERRNVESDLPTAIKRLGQACGVSTCIHPTDFPSDFAARSAKPMRFFGDMARNRLALRKSRKNTLRSAANYALSLPTPSRYLTARHESEKEFCS